MNSKKMLIIEALFQESILVLVIGILIQLQLYMIYDKDVLFVYRAYSDDGKRKSRIFLGNDSIISVAGEGKVCLATKNDKNQYIATTILEDNQGAIEISKIPKYHERTKLIDVAHHFVRDV